MKKLFALICVCAFAGSVASAQYLVYDYKASVKHLDTQISNVKYDPTETDGTGEMTTQALSSFKIVSDTFTGFFVVEQCSECSGSSYTSVAYGQSKLYILRKLDVKKKVWKFDSFTTAGLFNPGVAAPNSLDGYPTSIKKLKQAWMGIDFRFGDEYPWTWQTSEEGPIEVQMEAYPAGPSPYGSWNYGFLGLGSSFGDFSMTGFGAATATPPDPVFCDSPSDFPCFVITKVSGGILGWDWRDGICGDPASWDLCTLLPVELDNWGMNAVSYGAWSIKLNTKVTTAFNEAAATDYGAIGYEADLVLVKKLIKNATNNSLSSTIALSSTMFMWSR